MKHVLNSLLYTSRAGSSEDVCGGRGGGGLQAIKANYVGNQRGRRVRARGGGLTALEI